MTSIRFFTDEDVYGAIAVQLRAAGFDSVSTPEVDRFGELDESQLEWAAQLARTLDAEGMQDRLEYLSTPPHKKVSNVKRLRV
jgi:hypothetical protein